MSVRICYLQRASGGDAIAAVRLVGERSDETWVAPPNDPDASPTADVEAAADWIVQRLGAQGPRLGIDLLCLDADGSGCAWVSAPSAEPAVVAAIARQSASPLTDTEHRPVSPIALYAESPEDSVVAVLGEPAASGPPKRRFTLPARGKPTGSTPARPQRLPVLAVVDLPARLLIDALDERGVAVGGVCSVWQAVIAWFDRSRPASAPSAPDLTQGQVRASMVIDPAGRLLWAWSVNGSLLACGAARLPVERPGVEASEGKSAGGVLATTGNPGAWAAGAASTPILGPDQTSRLAADWLAWSVQLGRSPTRIACLAPAPGGVPHATGFGELLAKAWPTASLDLAYADDPIASVLSRLAETIDDRGSGGGSGPGEAVAVLAEPTARPTRAHRSLMIWSALGIAGLAGATGVAAYRVRVEAGLAWAEAQRVEGRWNEAVKSVDARFLAKPDQAILDMDKVIRDLEAASKPRTGGYTVMPIREEIATLAMVLGDPDLELIDLTVTGSLTSSVTIEIKGSLDQATGLQQALSEIAGSKIASWSSPQPTARGGNDPNRLNYRLIGVWAPDAGVRLGGAKP